jgi:hypothetical protein
VVSVSTHYWVEISTRWRASLGRWPAPVELHARFAVLQLAHGESLSQRIYGRTLSIQVCRTQYRKNIERMQGFWVPRQTV